MAQRVLVRAASECEDVATGLRSFKDALPDHGAGITSIIAKLYEISSLLTRLDGASQHPQYGPSFYRVRQDIVYVVTSGHATNRLILDMFGRTRSMSFARVWLDLNYQMTETQGVSLHERLDTYKGVLICCVAELREDPSPDSDAFLTALHDLLEAQQLLQAQRPQVDLSGVYRHVDAPLSPSTQSSDRPFLPTAPDPPLSPTWTNSSDNTYQSSQTSWSALGPQASQPVHWSKAVFDGPYPRSYFRLGHELNEPTRCFGPEVPEAILRLRQDGFIRALELSFDDGAVWIYLYYRPSDKRARILFAAGDAMHCAPLTLLKIVRDKSCLKLCKVLNDVGEHRYVLWANLNFVTFERMCLFYSTFVAMKRQDNTERLDPVLKDFEELGEKSPFGGKIKDRDMLHALKLFRDRSSGVVRLEASALRGPMAGVPLWTAFVTSYKMKQDIDWAHHLGNGLVSLVALKPAPYIFISGYIPPHRGNEWLLQFNDTKDAKEFITTWTALCRSANR